jgi:large repetitive protein
MSFAKKFTRFTTVSLSIAGLSVIALGTTPLAFADTITNSATVSTTTNDPSSSNNTATVTDTRCYRSDLSSNLSDSSTSINPLVSNSYQASIANAGPSSVTSVSFTFVYDAAQLTDPTSVTSTVGTLGTAVLSGSGSSRTYTNTITGFTLTPTTVMAVTVNNATLASATGTISAVFNTTPTGPTDPSPTCTIADPDTSNNSSTDTTAISTQSDLSLVKTSSGGSNSSTNTVGELIAGSNVTYTLAVTNNGPSTAVGPITVVDTLPSSVTYQSSTGTNWTCNLVGQTLTCTNPNNLVNGATSQVVLNVKVNDSAVVVN